MGEPDMHRREPAGGDGQNGSGPRRGAGRTGDSYSASVDGDASGPVVVGNHNVVIDGDGSHVTLIAPQQRPAPVRREQAVLLPRRQREPVGRERDLDALEAAVEEGGGLVQVWGPPGVGKSALLRYAAHCLEPGRDGVIFLSAVDHEVDDLAQKIFEACYEAPDYAPSRTEVQRLLAQLELMVYVDDVDLDLRQLRALTDAAPAATFVLASRERTLLGESTSVELRGLGPEASLSLLTRELRRPLPQGERAAADELCTLTLGLPLLLLRAAGLARVDGPSSVTLPRPAEISGLLPLLFQRLGAAQLRALNLFATLQGAELSAGHVGTLCDVSDPDALCTELAGLGLVVATERGYRGAADAVPEVRRRVSEPFPADRLCDHFAQWATAPGVTPADVADHARALEVAAQLAERHGQADRAVRLARAVSPLLARSLRVGVWGRLLDQGQRAADQTGDNAARAYFTHERAVRFLLLGQKVLAATLLAQAVVLWREIGNSHGAQAALDAQQYAPQVVPGHGAGGGAGSGGSGADVGSGAGSGSGTAGPTPDVGAPPVPDAGSSQVAAHGMPAGPTGSTSPATSAVPPAPDAPVSALHSTSQSVGQSSGAASGSAASGGSGAAAGGGAAASGAAAGGAAAASGGMGLLLAGAAALVVIGLGVQQIQEWNRDSAGSGTSRSGTGFGDAARAGGSGEPTWPDEPTPSDEPTEPDGLAGKWSNGAGDTFDVAESGDGSYTLGLSSTCGGGSLEFTGSNGRYSATTELHDQYCSVRGTKEMTVTLASDAQSADVVTTDSAQTDGTWECTTCGTETDTWTRVE